MTHLFLILYLLFVQSLFYFSILTLNLFNTPVILPTSNLHQKKKVELLIFFLIRIHYLYRWINDSIDL